MNAKETVEAAEMFSALGSMDKDSNPRMINYNIAGEPTGEQNYQDMQNISHISLQQEGDEYFYAVNGNTLKITPPTIAVQDKIWALTFTDITVGNILAVHFLNLNGSQFPIDCLPTYTIVLGDTLTSVTTNFGNAIATALTASGYTNTVNTATPGKITVQINSNVRVTGFDYQLILDVTNTEAINITTIQESWDGGVAGMCYPTGSKDWLGDLFITSSSVGQDQLTFNIIGSVASIGNDVIVKIAGNQLSKIISFGQAVTVQGVTTGAGSEADGTWINSASSFDGTNTLITLFNSVWVSNATTGTITFNVTGFLNISVSQDNLNTGNFTTYNLLQTKQVNSRWNHPYRDVEADSANDVINLYMTDNNDLMRIFSYTGPYMNNGAISYYNPLGFYTYEGIEDSLRLIIGNARSVVSNAVVINSGGGVFSGIWRYATVLRYSDLTSTYPSLLSRPVEVYSASQTNPISVMGNTAGVATTKQVQLTVIDIPVGLFTFLDLIGVNYVGGAEVGYFIKRVAIPAGASTMQVTHTGDETVQNYDNTQLNQQGVSYIKAGSLRIISDTLMMANMTTQSNYDLSAFAKTIQHTVIKGTTQLLPTGDDTTNWNVLGDYKNPTAQFQYQGGMDNETERLGLFGELNDGTFTNVFWVDDIRLDNFATNRANPFNDNRRVGSPFTNYDLSSETLTNTPGNNSYVTYLNLVIPDTDFIVNNVPLSSIFKRIHFCRINTVQYNLNEVKGCGLISRHCSGWYKDGGNVYLHGNDGTTTAPTGACSFENPFLFTGYNAILNTGMWQLNSSNPVLLDNLFNKTGVFTPYTYGAWNNPITVDLPIRPYDASLYIPDYIFGQTSIDGQPGDAIINYGQPNFVKQVTGLNYADQTNNNTFSSGAHPATGLWSTFIKMSGATSQVAEPTHNPLNLPGGFGAYANFNGVIGWSPPNTEITIMITAGLGFVLGEVVTDATTGHIIGTVTTASTTHTLTLGALTGFLVTSGDNLLGSIAGVATARSTGMVTQYAGHGVFGAMNSWSWERMKHYLIACTNRLDNVNTNMYNGTSGIPPGDEGAYDIGLYYVQYYRDMGSLTASVNAANYPNNTKFEGIETGVYVPTGYYLDLAPNQTNVNVPVFGFDTYTQKVLMKLQYPNTDTVTGNASDAGAGVSVAFFSQNRFNWNMRNSTVPAGMFNYPITDLGDWLNDGTPNVDDQEYDAGYTPRNIENQLPAFNSSTQTATHQGNLEVFTAVKIQGSISNAFRQLPPFNVHSEETDKGDITALVILDGELFVLQPRAVWRDFYTDIGTFRGSGTGEITLGSGLPFSKPAVLVSNNGCANRFSVIQGKDLNGSDVVCYMDTTNKKVMMLSRADGVEDISTKYKMRSWFENNLNTGLGDIPILGNSSASPSLRNSISGVFDEKRKEFIWTVVSNPAGVEWNSRTSFTAGTVVYYGAIDFNYMQSAYVALTNTTIGNNPVTNTGNQWAPLNNLQSCYTIVFSLKNKGFKTFYTPRPYFYAQWKNTYLSGYPAMDFNGLYLSDVGSELHWYDFNGGYLNDNGSLTYVNNAERQRYKEYFNLEVNSNIAPYRMDFNTEQYASFLLAAEFQNIDNILWRSQIKNDSLTSTPPGSNNQWTSPVRGSYMISKATFFAGQGQKISSFVTKYIKRLKY